MLLCGALAAFAAKKAVTIDDVLKHRSAPSIDPVWSPAGDAFAYLEHGSVYKWKSGDTKPSQWFSLDDLHPGTASSGATSHIAPYNWTNRHVSEKTLQWFPNGTDLLVSDEDALYIAHGSGVPKLLDAPRHINQPQLSPDGSQLLYESAADLYVFDLRTRKSRRLTNDGSATLWNGKLDWVYPEELELGQAAWWSPDSKSIAYLQFNVADEFVYPHADLLGERALSEPERYPQAGTPNAVVRLGVISAAGGNTVWMNAGNNPDLLLARVWWFADSSAIALEAAPRLQDELTLSFCDPNTGTAKKILQEHSKTWINITDNFKLLPSRHQFLWTSERSGFRHLYLYSETGKQIAQLTSGDWEVRGIAAVDETKGLVYYLSAEDSPLETQLYSVTLDSGKPTRITQPGFDHDIGIEPKGQLFIDEASNLTSPPETVLRECDGKSLQVLKPRETDLSDTYQLSVPEIMTLKAADGTELYGLLIKPANYQAGKRYPLIVDVYGGPQAQSVRNAWPRLSMDQVYAANGYLVWKLDNRGSFGRGHHFEEAVYHRLGSVEVADQRTGVNYLVSRGLADPNRVGITGWSYGGYMTTRCLLLAPDVFKVGVAGAPVTDWHNYDTIYTERYMGLPSQNVAGYEASSNVGAAPDLQGRLLIQHNFEDDNVLFQNTMQLVNALEQANKEYVLQLYPLHTHGVTGELRAPLYRQALDFFTANLH